MVVGNGTVHRSVIVLLAMVPSAENGTVGQQTGKPRKGLYNVMKITKTLQHKYTSLTNYDAVGQLKYINYKVSHTETEHGFVYVKMINKS